MKTLKNFMIDGDLNAGLKAVKERDGIGEGEQVRRAIRAWLESKGVLKIISTRKRAGSRREGRKQ